MSDKHECTECGKPGATVRNRDAAGTLHHFHPNCLLALRWWLAGHDTPLPRRYRGGPVTARMPLARGR